MSQIKVGDQVQVSMKAPRKEYFGKVGTVTRMIDDYQARVELENGEWIWEHTEYLIKLQSQGTEEQRRSSRGNSIVEELSTEQIIKIYTRAYREGLEHGFTMARRIYEEEE